MEVQMNNVLKSIITFFVASSAFFLGFYLGQEKIVSKIPDFQEDPED
jgi:hypothetical protein